MKLTIREIARRLALNMDTLERWIKQGRIPVTKRGDEGIFNETELKRWARSQRCSYRVSTQPDNNEHQTGSGMLALAMDLGGVFAGVEGSDKASVLKSCVSLVPGLSPDFQEILYAQLLEREALISTGIGKGIAIPHPRNPLDKGVDCPTVVTFFLDQPVDFDAIDDLPVFVLFLLLSPTVQDHLKLLSRLSFCLRDGAFVSFLKKIPEQEALLARVKKMETAIESKER
ncbi:PtsN1 [Desulforapulum autotrophicum HRM2]|uniref:PtsN1 n=1 Tax=Desulforapulum autotrophicum (strain ATCC 43914 / DSM 3382 / VKM B-1955 / HRM2) TaxID=177437 RepID=C0QAG3_DESAH|nr:PTS sugar transporter subunit IIA [Desulforapulum autotrophicum]ACN14748.1 PtsN1 [Desulforapulum autotrophicum HRM2]